MATKNKTYQPEFKREAVRLARAPENTVTGVARDLGLHANMLHRWIRQAEGREASGHPAFTGRGVPALSEHEQEIQRLKRELEIARQERDILKKALACLGPTAAPDGLGRFFAKDTR